MGYSTDDFLEQRSPAHVRVITLQLTALLRFICLQFIFSVIIASQIYYNAHHIKPRLFLYISLAAQFSEASL